MKYMRADKITFSWARHKIIVHEIGKIPVQWQCTVAQKAGKQICTVLLTAAGAFRSEKGLVLWRRASFILSLARYLFYSTFSFLSLSLPLLSLSRKNLLDREGSGGGRAKRAGENQHARMWDHEARDGWNKVAVL